MNPNYEKTEACSIAPPTEVETACAQLGESLVFLEQQIGRLPQRLAGVLRNQPESTSPDKAPELMLCPHAELLRGLQKRVQDAAVSIESLIRRIEL